MISSALVLTSCLLWGVAGAWLAVVDCRTRRLPTKIIWSAAGIVWVFYSAASLIETEASGLIGSVLGGLVCSSALVLVYFLNPAWMGLGDVRLSALNGLLCGWWGWQTALFGLAAGFAAAFPSAIWVLAREGPKASRPLGPYLVAGTAAVVTWAAISRGLIPFR